MLILHGTNLVASRKSLTDQKEQAVQKGWEVITLEGKSLDLTQLKQALESSSLFGSQRLVVIENLFSLPKSKLKESLLDYLKTQSLFASRPDKVEDSRSKDRNYPLSADVIIWEGKQIDGRSLKSFSKAKILTFKISPFIFKFLDSLGPGKAKETLTFLSQTLETEPPELVFYLLARRIKDLMIAKDLGKKGLAKMAPWQQGRLVYQANKFSLPRLLELHQQLLQTDWEQKTGRVALNLKEVLDLLIVDL